IKLNDVEPLAYLADVLTRIVNGHPNSQLEELLPWSYSADKMLPRQGQTWSIP
ncbi:transposase domain-containing protein, partial [Rhizobium sp. Leaf391]|uniref:transposase domain-containing protein n=1 Tax=Rhizobium sp. Leaf391 TaxID=1736360 RepID=UPI001FCD21AC